MMNSINLCQPRYNTVFRGGWITSLTNLGYFSKSYKSVLQVTLPETQKNNAL